MKRTFLTALLLSCLMAGYAQMPMRVYEEPKGDPPPMSLYFEKVTDEASTPDDMGFIRRWTILEPINKPNRTNNIFSEEYLAENLDGELFSGQWTKIPEDGQKVKAGKQKLQWHSLDSKNYNVKLFRFASAFKKQLYGVIFCVVTVVHCDNDIDGVRLAVGSNGASSWWVNSEKTIVLNYDRRMVMDDCVSVPLTLKKGDNVIRGMLINGPGMSDFCLRFIDNDGKPVTNITIP